MTTSTEQRYVAAIVVKRNGGPRRTRTLDTTLSAPTDGEVFVRHEVISVNFVDIYRRRGDDPVPVPFTPGMEAAGVAGAVGPNVMNVRVAQAVGGDVVLVHAAAGGVGLRIVQFARHYGARVIATVSSQPEADGIGTHEELLARANDIIEGIPRGLADIPHLDPPATRRIMVCVALATRSARSSCSSGSSGPGERVRTVSGRSGSIGGVRSRSLRLWWV